MNRQNVFSRDEDEDDDEDDEEEEEEEEGPPNPKETSLAVRGDECNARE